MTFGENAEQNILCRDRRRRAISLFVVALPGLEPSLDGLHDCRGVVHRSGRFLGRGIVDAVVGLAASFEQRSQESSGFDIQAVLADQDGGNCSDNA